MQLVPENDPILRQAAQPFNFVNPPINPFTLAEQLFSVMENKGLGLAAPQIGLSYTVFAMNVHQKKYICFNPRILQVSEEFTTFKEGCLSFPNLYLNVRRPASVKVKYQIETGAEIEEELITLPARVFQHEFDHLQGIVFTDKVAKLSLKLAMDRRRKERNV